MKTAIYIFGLVSGIAIAMAYDKSLSEERMGIATIVMIVLLFVAVFLYIIELGESANKKSRQFRNYDVLTKESKRDKSVN